MNMQILKRLFRRKPAPRIDKAAVARHAIIAAIETNRLSAWQAARLLSDLADGYRCRFAASAPVARAP